MGNAHDVNRVLITGDIFQSGQFASADFISNDSLNTLLGESLYHLLRIPVARGTGLNASLLRPEALHPQVLQTREMLLGTGEVTRGRLAKLLQAQPFDGMADLFAPVFRNTVVLGFCMSPLMTGLLTQLGALWINMSVYPLQCLGDVTLGFAASHREIREGLRKRMIPRESIDMAVAVQNARYMPTVRNFTNRFPANSLLLVPQGILDLPALDSNGQLATFDSFGPLLDDLHREYERVFVYWPDADSVPEDMRRVQRIMDAEPLPPDAHLRPLAMFFSHPAIAAVAGISTQFLAEAALYGKPPVSFRPYHTRYGHVEGLDTAEDAPESFPIAKECFTPGFWRDLFSLFMPVPNSDPELWTPPPINLRLILRGAGADFDDAQSYRHCQWLGRHEQRVKSIEERLEVLSMAGELQDDAKRGEGIPAAGMKAAPQTALFAAGSGSFVLPSIVALHSARANSGIRELFYFSDAACITEEDITLLRDCDITPVLSDYSRQFRSLYALHTHAAAYLVFIAPEILAERGYRYSLGVHGDTLCIRPFDPDIVFRDTHFISGAHTIFMKRSMLFKNLDKILSLPRVVERLLHCQVVNPGILFFNNMTLADYRFSRAAHEAFMQIGSEDLLYNEESLLAFISLQNENMLSLIDGAFNFLCPSRLCTQKPVFLHFSDRIKPWHDKGSARQAETTGFLRDAAGLWRDAALNILGPQRYNALLAGVSHHDVTGANI